MLNRQLIFSNKWQIRVQRHVLFWLFWWIYFGLLHAVIPMGSPSISYMRNLPFTISESFLLLLPQFLIVYPLLYFVLPRYFFRNKYVQGTILFFLLMLISGMVNLYMIRHINPVVLKAILPTQYQVQAPRSDNMNFAMAMIGAMKGGLTCAGMAGMLKLFKHWFLKEQRNMELINANNEVQLQLLTAQVNPHFLFNTLNNIYSRTQIESPEGARMVLQLSHIMRYILDEGPKASVPLRNEIALINDYINLECQRYDERMDLHLSLPADTEGLMIAPLVLLPFVENCFKHGTSNMIDNPWINLKITLEGNTLHMKLMNGKKLHYMPGISREGTGINNTKRRLDLIYGNTYSVEVINEAEVFIINLSIPLQGSRVEVIKPAYAY